MNLNWDKTLSELAIRWPEDALQQFTALFAQALKCEMAMLVLPEGERKIPGGLDCFYGFCT